MVGVTFIGRLGNQIFQYVFLEYLRKKNPTLSFFVPNPRHGLALSTYFDLGLYNNLTLSSRIYSLIVGLIPKIIRFEHVPIRSFSSPKPLTVRNNTIYWGYYQTDWYLKQLGDIDLRIKTRYTEKFNELYGELFSMEKTIAIHIRRTDYLNTNKRDISLPIEYFRSRLNDIERLDSYKVFFLSDDIQFVKDAFDQRDNFIFSQNNEIIDFQLIMNADIAIISNSSFSWWAAYLSKKNNIVYAPKNWVGFRLGRPFPKDIMTDRFTWCDVTI